MEAPTIEELQAENERLHAELLIRDAEVKKLVLASVKSMKTLGLDFDKLKKNPINHIVSSGLLWKFTTGGIKTEELSSNFSFIGELVEKYRYLVEDEITLL